MPRRQNISPIKGRRALNVNDFCQAFGPSRSATYALIRAGKLPDIKIGGRRVIPIDAAEKLLKPEEPAA
jgi:predicted DNA-binding transcriptional regulator AlpA